MRWWESEIFWRDIGPFLFSPAVWAAAKDDLDELIELAEVSPGQQLLDLGCGPGRYLLPLTEQGFSVVGVEHCAAFRRALRERARAQMLDPDIRNVDVLARVEAHIIEAQSQQERPDPQRLASELGFGMHDAVLDIFALLGYHEAPLVDAVLVQTMYYFLKPGGWLVVQAREPQLTTGTVKHSDGQGGLCVEERRYDRSTRVMSTRWTVNAQGRQRALQSAVRVYQRQDLQELMRFGGFEEVAAWSSKADERLTVIGRRSA